MELVVHQRRPPDQHARRKRRTRGTAIPEPEWRKAGLTKQMPAWPAVGPRDREEHTICERESESARAHNCTRSQHHPELGGVLQPKDRMERWGPSWPDCRFPTTDLFRGTVLALHD